MRVGIDFDNTIANYERVFVTAAQTRGWLPTSFRATKRELRDRIRLLPDGELKWQMLQGEVYGSRMAEATPFAGVTTFFRAARAKGIDLFIVSHKTRTSPHDPHRIDLRQAAQAWLASNKFFDPAGVGFEPQRVFFEDTRADKIARIKTISCAIFIDDLMEVFADPEFPFGIERILFSRGDTCRSPGSTVVCSTWHDIGTHVFGRPAQSVGAPADNFLLDTARRLTGKGIRAVTPSRAGGNNRIYRVETTQGAVFALKAYPRQANDHRDRLGTEFKALRFLHRHDITQVPRPIVADAASGHALYEWIEGGPARADTCSVLAALTLLKSLDALREKADARELPDASEACLSAGEIVNQIERRLGALSSADAGHAEFESFLSEDFAHVMDRAVAQARLAYATAGLSFDEPIDTSRRRLCPSDFGFHNALVRPDGRIVFLDFEYFGWDDPAKVCCDFILHPGMDLTEELQRYFLVGVTDIFGIDATFADRLAICLPLYALRWTLILLNEFLPDRWRRRVLAGESAERSEVLNRQLAKARTMLTNARLNVEGCCNDR